MAVPAVPVLVQHRDPRIEIAHPPLRFSSPGVGCWQRDPMAATARPVTEIQIAGNAYRVQSSADAAELARLVAIVEARLSELPKTQRHEPRSLVLVALSLAHDLEQLKQDHAAFESQVLARLTKLVGRVDVALDHRDENGEPLPPIADSMVDAGPNAGRSPSPAQDDPPADSANATAIATVAPSPKAEAVRRGRPTRLPREANEQT